MQGIRIRIALAASMLAGAIPSLASAQIFSGVDVGTGIAAPGPGTPNTTAARNNMLTALGITPFTLNTFEGLALGQTINLGGGVTASYTSEDLFFGGIRNSSSAFFGYNTTAGGSQFLGQSPNAFGATGTLTLNFATAINFFGGYFTGVGGTSAPTTAIWGAASFAFPNSDADGTGGIQWFGFVAPASASFTSVNFTNVSTANVRDIWGMDDIIYGSRSDTVTTPEPGTYVLMFAGLGALALAARRRRSV